MTGASPGPGGGGSEAPAPVAGEEASAPARRRRRWVPRWLLVPVVLVLAVALYVGGTFVQVWQASGRDAQRRAEAIVVLGAAQYDGRPSPALKNRLDHALTLYRRGLAPMVVVTGGRQTGDRFTEATAGYNYLRDHGVPDRAIRKEVQGRTTYESLAAVARFLAAEDVDDVVLVSGPAHSKRLSGIASQVGLHAAISPADGSPDGRSLIRETVAVSAGRLIGYRRLERLDR
ncbi:YdcF family protein [Aquihabitans sp. G128]|uniref:YdcF family protein n=1 Tax=Aquihabitans sp. G128 TaxID=2849779 RepID=UPI001C23BDD2|nr:YdcF family protein [Aquihabitans sp. G128]QXC63059.1 YdcF family protein [Aquihabitans sp. G128]